MSTTSPALIRVTDAMAQLHCCRTKYYHDTNAGLLPPIVHRRKAAFVPAAELETVIAATIAGHSEDQLRALVRTLVAKRAATFAAMIDRSELKAA